MKNILKAILFTFALAVSDEVVYWLSPSTPDVSLFFRDLQICMWVAVVYHMLPAREIESRTITFIFFLYCLSESLQYFVFFYTDYSLYLLTYTTFTALCLAFFLYNKFKEYHTKSDPIQPGKNIYLCFWRPFNDKSLLGSLLGLPFGGMSIYSNGILWGFRWEKKGFTCGYLSPKAAAKSFVVYDTGIKLSPEIINELKKLNESSAGLLRVRCIYTVRNVLRQLGDNYKIHSPLEYIPSVYAKKVFSNGIN